MLRAGIWHFFLRIFRNFVWRRLCASIRRHGKQRAGKYAGEALLSALLRPPIVHISIDAVFFAQ